MSAPRTPAAAALTASVGLAVALAVGGCGSSSSTNPKVDAPDTGTVSTTSVAPSTSTPDTSAPATSSTSAQAAGMPLLQSGAVPAVTGATDLTKEPTIAPGTPPAPTQPTGKDLVVGTGTVAGPGATVQVQYVGTIFDTGKVFDASWTDGNGPATFPLSGVIPGFKDAIVGMAVGGRREVVIPPAEGYGASGSGPIPPNSTLVFVIDLLKVQQ
ncbi:MAG TPA: FKBP-type peptidyl-prolyl cis-trans isomerase [Acidimicrobiales bacterium]|nr:FKBP-type peptidyl-prolyl cis-trans isomerase [Acidimicrobiales bacterium]